MRTTNDDSRPALRLALILFSAIFLFGALGCHAHGRGGGPRFDPPRRAHKAPPRGHARPHAMLVPHKDAPHLNAGKPGAKPHPGRQPERHGQPPRQHAAGERGKKPGEMKPGQHAQQSRPRAENRPRPEQRKEHTRQGAPGQHNRQEQGRDDSRKRG